MPIIAPGSIATVGALIEAIDARSIVLFAGGRAFESSGASAALDRALVGREVFFIRDISANPDVDAVNAAIAQYRDASPGLSIAVGGGSVLDLAKVVNVVAPHTQDARPYLVGHQQFLPSPVPLVAIPTTAGSGSEVTRYAVVTVEGEKIPFGDPALIPQHVILDPLLTHSLPPHVTASTGLDALAQAMESMWSIHSDGTSREVAVRALGLAWRNLEAAVHRPDAASRAAMFEAAHLSGLAIDRSPTSAPHALSLYLTTSYGVPHGHAVALTLGAALEFNSSVSVLDVVDQRGVAHVKAVLSDIVNVLGGRDPHHSRVMLYDMIDAVGLEPTLKGVGAGSREARDSIASCVHPVRLANNPRGFGTNALRTMIETIE